PSNRSSRWASARCAARRRSPAPCMRRGRWRARASSSARCARRNGTWSASNAPAASRPRVSATSKSKVWAAWSRRRPATNAKPIQRSSTWKKIRGPSRSPTIWAAWRSICWSTRPAGAGPTPTPFCCPAPADTQEARMIVGTAGHIDHGKTALVRALTGVDTDRLPAEKARGITIDLGFAALELGTDRLALVDVPGHERFIRNMLAGATGLDLAVLVVAADDSVMPQTREHLEILRLLGLAGGLVVLTKCDLADPDWLALVEEEVRGLVAEVGRGMRAAINLVGVHHTEIRRGQELAARGYLEVSRIVSVEIRVSDDAPRPLRHRGRYRLHLGTAEVAASVALLEGNEL